MDEIWQESMGSESTSKVFPGFDKLFLLGSPGSSQAFRASIDVESDDAFRLTRAETQPAQPVALHWAMGRARPVEVIRTTMGIVFIISDSVVQLLRSHGFTGWSLYDVAVRDKRGQPLLGYSGLAVTGRCGNIDPSRSVQVPRIRPGGIFPVWKGLIFDPASWDGSDFFMPTGFVGFVFVVEAVKKALEQAKTRNVDFTALDQFERSWDL
jgi:hypothetical protein